MADRQFTIDLPLDKMLYFIIEMFVHDIVHDMHLATQLPRVLGVQTKLGRDFFPTSGTTTPYDTMVGTFGGGAKRGGNGRKRGAADADFDEGSGRSDLSEMLSERDWNPDDNERMLDNLKNLINSFNQPGTTPNLWMSNTRIPGGAAAGEWALLAFNPEFVKGADVKSNAKAIGIGPTAFYINNTRVSPFLAMPCTFDAKASHASATDSACSKSGDGIYNYVYPDGVLLEQATNGVLFSGPGGAGWTLSYKEGTSLELRTNWNATATDGTPHPIVLSFIPASMASVQGLIADRTAAAAFVAANRGTITQWVLNNTLEEITDEIGGVSNFEQCLTVYPGQAFIRYAYLSQFFVDIIQSAQQGSGGATAQSRLQQLQSLSTYVWNGQAFYPPIVLGATVAREARHLTETQITSSPPYQQWVTELYRPLIEACEASVLKGKELEEIRTELAGWLGSAQQGQGLDLIQHVMKAYGLVNIVIAARTTVFYLVPLFFGMEEQVSEELTASDAGVAWNNPEVLLGAIFVGNQEAQKSAFAIVKNVLLRCVQVLVWIDAQLDKQKGSTGLEPVFAGLGELGPQIGIPHLAVAAIYIRSASDAIQQYEGENISLQEKGLPDIEAASGIGESMGNIASALEQNQQILASVNAAEDLTAVLNHLVTLVQAPPQGQINDPKILYDAFLLGDYNNEYALAMILHLLGTAPAAVENVIADLRDKGLNLPPYKKRALGEMLRTGAQNVTTTTASADEVLKVANGYGVFTKKPEVAADPSKAQQEVLGIFLDLYLNAVMLNNGQTNLDQLEANRAAIEVEPGMEGGGYRRETGQKGGAKSAAPIWDPKKQSFVLGIFNSALTARRSKASKFRGQYEVMLNMTEAISQVYRTKTVGNFGFSPNFRVISLLGMGLPKSVGGYVPDDIFQISDELQNQTWPILNTSMSDNIYRKMIDYDFVIRATTITGQHMPQTIGDHLERAIAYLEGMGDQTNEFIMLSGVIPFKNLMDQELKGAIYSGLTGHGYVNSNDELLEAVRAVEAFQNNISFVLSIAYMALCQSPRQPPAQPVRNINTLVQLEQAIEADTATPQSQEHLVASLFRPNDPADRTLAHFASYIAAKLKAYRQLLKDAREILDATDKLYVESQIAFAFSMAGVAKSVTYPVGKFLEANPSSAALFEQEMKIVGPVLAGAAGWKKAGLVPTKSISGVDAASLRQFQNMMNNTALRGDTFGHYVERGKATISPGKLNPGFIADLGQTVIGATPAFAEMNAAYQRNKQFFISNFVVAGGFLDFNELFLCPMSSITDNQPTCSSIKSTTTKGNGILWAPMDVRIRDPNNIFTYRIVVTYKKPTNPANPPNEVYIWAYLKANGQVLINLGSMDEVQGIRSAADLEYAPPDWPGGANPCIVAPTDGGSNQPMDAKQCLASVMQYLQKEGARGTDWADGARPSWTRWLERLGDDDAVAAGLRRGLMEAAFQKGLGDFLQELNGFLAQYGYTKPPKWSKNPDDLAAWQKIVAQFNNDQPSALRTLLFILFTRNDGVINPNAISGYLSKTKYLVATRSGKVDPIVWRGGRKKRTLKKKRNKRNTRNKKRTAKKKPQRRTIQKKRKGRKNNKKGTRRNRKTK